MASRPDPWAMYHRVIDQLNDATALIQIINRGRGDQTERISQALDAVEHVVAAIRELADHVVRTQANDPAS